jgi:hypothetical protein
MNLSIRKVGQTACIIGVEVGQDDVTEGIAAIVFGTTSMRV